jgi:general secretion pathway protein G
MLLDYQKRGAVSNRALADPQRRWLSWLFIACMLLPVALAALMVVEHFWPGPRYGPGNGLISPSHDIHVISEALEQFHTDNGRYPTTAEGLQVLVQKPVGANLPNWQQILTAIPVDPWGHPYHYELLSGATKDFDLRSDGPDGKPGGGDDISN